MIWGVTGTRHGATPLQIASVGWLFSRYEITELHDGDCIGVDEQVYHLGRAFGAHITLHPPIVQKYQALCGDHKDTVREAKSYHERDKDTVNESESLVACPQHSYEEDKSKSGTWWTVDYARSLNRPIVIVWPNGHISYENWTWTYE